MSKTLQRLATGLSQFGQRFYRFVLRSERSILFGCMGAFVVVMSLIAARKLSSFGYNALDLGIYRQVFEESLRGRLFNFTIHPHSFLGDHLELFLVVLMPVYALLKTPLTLLILQIVALGVAAWPLAIISARIIGRPWHLLIALAWLLNPAVQNMALFEFHGLIFAVPLLAFAALAYIEKRLPAFLIWTLLALTVREDVALVLIGFGLLAVVDRRHWKWIVAPIVVGVGWLAGAMIIAANLNASGEYKFLAYYHWLGPDGVGIATAIFAKPWLIIQQVLRGQNFTFLLALLLPFLFLPVMRPRWLIPVGLVFIQLLLLPVTGVLVTQTHYAALLIPFLSIATAEAIAWWQKRHGQPGAVGFLLSVTVIYAALTLGPFIPALQETTHSGEIRKRVRLQQAIAAELPPNNIVSSYSFLPALANRPRLYSLHYVFLGHKQFSDATYVLPAGVTTVVMDLDDFLLYQLMTPQETSRGGYARLRQMLTDRFFGVTTYIDRFVVFQKVQGAADLSPLVQEAKSIAPSGDAYGDLRWAGLASPQGYTTYSQTYDSGHAFQTIWLDLAFEKFRASNTIYQLELAWQQNDQTIAKRLVPLGGGVFPTSDWPIDEQVVSRYRLLVPPQLTGQKATLRGRIVVLDGSVGLDRLGRQIPIYTKYQSVGPSIPLGEWQL